MPAPNLDLNDFTQVADLASCDLASLAEVHRDGMTFWNCLKGRGAGIDPVRDDSIVVRIGKTKVRFAESAAQSSLSDKRPKGC